MPLAVPQQDSKLKAQLQKNATAEDKMREELAQARSERMRAMGHLESGGTASKTGAATLPEWPAPGADAPVDRHVAATSAFGNADNDDSGKLDEAEFEAGRKR